MNETENKYGELPEDTDELLALDKLGNDESVPEELIALDGENAEAEANGKDKGELITVVGVRFKASGKIYYFDPAGMTFANGDNVITLRLKRELSIEGGNTVNLAYGDSETVCNDDLGLERKVAKRLLSILHNRHERTVVVLMLCYIRLQRLGLLSNLFDSKWHKLILLTFCCFEFCCFSIVAIISYFT